MGNRQQLQQAVAKIPWNFNFGFQKCCGSVDKNFKDIGIIFEEKSNLLIGGLQAPLKVMQEESEKNNQSLKIMQNRFCRHYKRSDTIISGLLTQLVNLPEQVIKITDCRNVNILSTDIDYCT